MTNFKQAIKIQGVTHGTAVVRLSHTDLTAAAVAEAVTLATLRDAHPNGAAGAIPANARIMFMWGNLIEEFSGGAVATCVVDVGEVAADVDELMAAENVFTAAGAGLKPGAGALTLPAFSAAAYVGQVAVTTTAANVAALTAGELDICILYESYTTNSLTG